MASIPPAICTALPLFIEILPHDCAIPFYGYCFQRHEIMNAYTNMNIGNRNWEKQF